MVIPHHEAADMIRGLKEDKTLERIAFALTNIEVRNAEARSEKDREGILKAINNSQGGPDEVNQAIAKQMRSWIIGVVSEHLGSNSVEALFAKTPKKTICLMRLYSDMLFFDDRKFKAYEVVRMTLRRYGELRDVPEDLLDLVRTVNQHVADYPLRESEEGEEDKRKSKKRSSSRQLGQAKSFKHEVDQGEEDEEDEKDAEWTLEEFRTEVRVRQRFFCVQKTVCPRNRRRRRVCMHVCVCVLMFVLTCCVVVVVAPEDCARLAPLCCKERARPLPQAHRSGERLSS